MRIRSRLTVLAVALFAVLALVSGASVSAGEPVTVEGCELVIQLPGSAGTARICICQNGPPM